MFHNHHHKDDRKGGERIGVRSQKPWYPNIGGLAAGASLLLLGYYLWAGHQAHLFAVLPFAIFLLCPLMHLFGHGHAHRDHAGHKREPGPLHDDKPADGSAGSQL